MTKDIGRRQSTCVLDSDVPDDDAFLRLKDPISILIDDVEPGQSDLELGGMRRDDAVVVLDNNLSIPVASVFAGNEKSRWSLANRTTLAVAPCRVTPRDVLGDLFAAAAGTCLSQCATVTPRLQGFCELLGVSGGETASHIRDRLAVPLPLAPWLRCPVRMAYNIDSHSTALPDGTLSNIDF